MHLSSRTRFIVFIAGSVAVSMVLVATSIAMYFSSGTAQVDLSRPGYQSVRSQTKPEDPYKGFSSSGPIDDKTLDEFESLYKDRASDATSLDAFNPDVLGDNALGLDEAAPPSE